MSKNFKIKIKSLKLRRRNLLILIMAAVILILIIQAQQTNQIIPYYTPSPKQELTEEEKYILNPPAANASISAKEKHKAIVAKLAKDTEKIDFRDCKPNPLVVKAKWDSEIKIVNNDSVERKIIIDSKNIFNVPPKDVKIVKTQFKYGTGDYGYVCEGVGIVGFLHVVK